MTNNSDQSDPNTRNELLIRLFNQYRQNNRVIISISIFGIILFTLVALAFPFRDEIFKKFYPKLRSQATSCSGSSQIPPNRAGFIFTGGDLEQAIAGLNTSLYSAYDLSLGPQKSFFVIGKYVQNQSDPLGLRLLMENSLSNIDFKGLPGQQPAGWNMASSSGTAVLNPESENTKSKGTSVKLTNGQNPLTQITQTFKKSVSAGQLIVFGSWVKVSDRNHVQISIQDSQNPAQEFGIADVSQIEPNYWTYVVGFGRVPAGVASFQLALKVTGSGNTAWFRSASAAIAGSDQNQIVTNLVLQRCGSAWMIDDAPGWEQSSASPFMKPLSTDVYAIIYNQFYSLIKNVDPSAKVMPGGLMGAPIVFDNSGGYSPKSFLDNFRASYKKLFNSEPPIDVLGVRYLAVDQNRWLGSTDLENYLTKLRSYMDQITEWKGKPIWLTRLGVSNSAPNNGIDFLQAAMKFLNSNNLNIEKWFWYDTCGFNSQMAPLFVSNNKICSWPMKLTALGQAYVTANILPTPTPTPTPTSTPTSTPGPTLPLTGTPSATIAATPRPTSQAPTSTASANVKEGTASTTEQK